MASGGADKAGRMFDITTGQTTQVAQHAEPIKCVKFLDQAQQILATGSWDKTLKYWDLRSPQPIGTIQLPERCYALDSSGPLMVAATAEKHVCIFDLNNPTVIFKVRFFFQKLTSRLAECWLFSATTTLANYVTTKVANKSRLVFPWPQRIRYWFHRRSSRYTVCRGQRPIVSSHQNYYLQLWPRVAKASHSLQQEFLFQMSQRWLQECLFGERNQLSSSLWHVLDSWFRRYSELLGQGIETAFEGLLKCQRHDSLFDV